MPSDRNHRCSTDGLLQRPSEVSLEGAGVVLYPGSWGDKLGFWGAVGQGGTGEFPLFAFALQAGLCRWMCHGTLPLALQPRNGQSVLPFSGSRLVQHRIKADWSKLCLSVVLPCSHPPKNPWHLGWCTGPSCL